MRRTIGNASFQGYTLVAMLIYSLLTGLAGKLAAIIHY